MPDLQRGEFPPTDDQQWLDFIQSQLASKRDREQKIQKILKKLGLYAGEISGIIGPEVTNAVKGFQQAENLEADGIVGPTTWNALLKKAREENMDIG